MPGYTPITLCTADSPYCPGFTPAVLLASLLSNCWGCFRMKREGRRKGLVRAEFPPNEELPLICLPHPFGTFQRGGGNGFLFSSGTLPLFWETAPSLESSFPSFFLHHWAS